MSALARALRLDAAQTAYVRALATAGEDPEPAGDIDAPDQKLRDVLEAVGDNPAWIVSRSRDLLLVNEAASALYGGWTRRPDANVARWLLLDPEARVVLVDWEIWARTLLARLRTATAGLRDEHVADLVAQLRAESAWVRSCWDRHEVFAPPATMTFRRDGVTVVTRPTFLRQVGSARQELVVHRVMGTSAVASRGRI